MKENIQELYGDFSDSWELWQTHLQYVLSFLWVMHFYPLNSNHSIDLTQPFSPRRNVHSEAHLIYMLII